MSPSLSLSVFVVQVHILSTERRKKAREVLKPTLPVSPLQHSKLPSYEFIELYTGFLDDPSAQSMLIRLNLREPEKIAPGQLRVEPREYEGIKNIFYALLFQVL